VDISVYSMEPEFTTTAGDATCGVYAHEMGHSVFGLPTSTIPITVRKD